MNFDFCMLGLKIELFQYNFIVAFEYLTSDNKSIVEPLAKIMNYFAKSSILVV